MSARRLTLAISPPPVHDETLASWMERIAAENDQPLIWALYQVGLSETFHYKDVPAGYGFRLTPDQVTSISRATGVPEQTVVETTVASWVPTGMVTAVDRFGTDVSTDIKGFSRANWFYSKGSNYCPACLSENGGAWLRSWKQPWHFACPTHRSALLPLCLGCGQRANFGRIDGGWKPLFPAYVPMPGCCHNSRSQPGKRRVKGPCLHDHRLDAPGDLLNDELHQVQESLLNERQPFPWWNDMRALSAYVLNVLEVDSVEDVLGFRLPEPTREAWNVQRQARLQRLEEGRERYKSEGLSPKTISQDTTGRTPPTDPLVMAPAAAVAYKAITKSETLGHLASFSRSDAVHLTPASRLSNLRASEDLQERVKVAYIQDPGLYATGLHSHYRSRIAQPVSWDPENLPPFLWHDLYDAHLGQILVQITRPVGRRFASMALYRAATGSTWIEAHAKFDDGNFVRKTFSRLLDANRTQNGGPGKEAIAEAIAATSLDLNTDSRIDTYPRLRAAATTLLTEPVPHDVYAGATNVTRRSQPTDLQLRYAAIWLWANLTEDEPRNAPGWYREGTKFLQGSYHQWLRRLGPDELQRLREWGHAQLASLLTVHSPT